MMSVGIGDYVLSSRARVRGVLSRGRDRFLITASIVFVVLVPLFSGNASASSGDIGAWATAHNSLPVGISEATTVTANGYVYVMGGIASNNGENSTNTVYYAPLHSDGTVGAWVTSSNSLPDVLFSATSVVANGYVYVMGGYGGSAGNSSVSSVFYAHLNADGSVGAWSTSSNPLPVPLGGATSVVANGYVYVMGGNDDITQTIESTVYYAQLNADGSVGAWTTASNGLPQGRFGATSIIANGYVYVIGGYILDPNLGSVTEPNVYYAQLNTDGTVGAWSTSPNSLPDGRAYSSSVVANGYVYVLNGASSSGLQSTVLYAQLNTDGSVGPWSTSSNSVPTALVLAGSVMANGYVYVIGGEYSTAIASTVYYASTTPVATPSFPTNLTATSPTQYPSLNWNASSGATSYNFYRNGTNIGSTTNTSYTDNTAHEGTDTYSVTAVNSAGESGHSNSVSVLVDRTTPTITYSVSPTPNSNGWNHSPATITFTCSDNTGGSGIAFCSSPQTESTDGTYTLTGTAVDNAGNTSSVSVTVNIDQTAPTLGTPTWTNNPMTTTQSTTVTVPVSDNLSGVTKGEYYLGTTDPGQGNGSVMSLNNGNLSASFSNMTAGIYTVNFRAEDNAGNWSPVTTDYLVVYDTSNSSADGHSNDIEPIYGTDVLPGLIQTGQTDKEHFAFTVKYKNGTLDPASKLHFVYKTGTHCNNPNQATNCHDTTLDATSFAWMVINGTNNSVATIQGIASLTIDGVTTTNPFRIITTDGSLLNPQTTDQFELDIYAPGANPNTAQPIYHLNDPLAKGNVVVKS